MSYNVAIRRNATGEVRVSEHEGDWDKGPSFGWVEGNFGCDCNRHDAFERVLNPEYEGGHECGHSAYSVLYAELPNGERLSLQERL